MQAILPYLSSNYEPGLQGIFIKKVFYYIVYLYNCLSCTTTSLLPTKVGTTKHGLIITIIINHQPATSNQMLLDTI